jgi:hypothetical protein
LPVCSGVILPKDFDVIYDPKRYLRN